MTGIPLLVAFVVLLVILAIAFSSVGRNLSAFFRLCSMGLTAGDTLFLAKVAKSVGVAGIYDLMESPIAIDRCAAVILRQASERGTSRDRKTQDVLSALYELRRNVDLNDSRKRAGLATTREIKAGQPLRIVYSGVGAFSSKVIENTQHCLVIDLPHSPSVMSTKIDWAGKPVKVFFHRADDAGYVFFTNVIPLDASDKRAVLQLRHSDKVTRFQMRQNTRVKCSIPAKAYLIEVGMSEREMESEPGSECVLQDLSGKGAMICSDAEISRGTRIKIQFMIQDEPIVMAGIVKESNYSAQKNSYLINFECTSISPAMKNTILAFVYNVLPEDKESDEADIMADFNAKSVD